MVVNRDPLMGQRIDAGDLGGEGRIGKVPEGKPLALDKSTDDFRSCGEVQNGRDIPVGWRLGFGGLFSYFAYSLFDSGKTVAAWTVIGLLGRKLSPKK